MSEPERRFVDDALGEEYKRKFLNAETRDYDSIETDSLVDWAQLIGGRAPGQEEAAPLEVDFAMSAQMFQAEKEARFPNYEALERYYYSLSPNEQERFRNENQVWKDYRKWETGFLSDNPELIPYVISRNSELQNAPPHVQEVIVQYWDLGNKLGISELWDEYFELPYGSGARSKFYNSHPEFKQYKEAKEKMMAWFPESIPYLMSVDDVAKEVLGDDYQKKYDIPNEPFIEQLSDETRRAMFASSFGDPLTAGARAELKYWYEKYGSKWQSFDEWLDALL